MERVSKTYTRIAMYDFDGTLFRSWEATPKWWAGTELDKGPYSFFTQPESLGPPCVPEKPPADYWIGKAVSAARRDSGDRNVFVVVVTGRVKVHRRRVLALLKSKGINPQASYFNPGMSAASFKVAVLWNLLAGFPSVDAVDVWENENQAEYKRKLLQAGKILDRDIEVTVHSIEVPPKPLVCGPQDFGLVEASARRAQRVARGKAKTARGCDVEHSWAWISPSGKLIEVDDHGGWGIENFPQETYAATLQDLSRESRRGHDPLFRKHLPIFLKAVVFDPDNWDTVPEEALKKGRVYQIPEKTREKAEKLGLPNLSEGSWGLRVRLTPAEEQFLFRENVFPEAVQVSMSNARNERVRSLWKEERSSLENSARHNASEVLYEKGWISASHWADLGGASEPSPKQWESFFQQALSCWKKQGLRPAIGREKLYLAVGRSHEAIPYEDAIERYCPRQLQDEIYEYLLSDSPSRIARGKASARRVATLKQSNMDHDTSIALMKWLTARTKRMGIAQDVYVVGGAVRNFVLDQPIKDIDMVVDSLSLGRNRDAEWLAQQLAQRIPTTTQIVTSSLLVSTIKIKGSWVLDGYEMEGNDIDIADARAEEYAVDPATGEYTGHKPISVSPTTMEDDVSRREFTFNTLLWRLMDLAQGPDKAEIIDLTGCGVQDLNDRVMRCPGDPDEIFAKDPTRIIRTIKFAFKYGMKLPPDVKAAAKRQAKGLKRIPSKAWTVLQTIVFDNPQYKKALDVMEDLGVTDVLAEMMQSNKQFATTLGTYSHKRGLAYMFDLMDVGIPVGAPMKFLDPAQQKQLRQITTGMERDDALAYLEALKNPGKVYDKKFIPTLAMNHGYSGSQMREFMGQVIPIGREALLADPSLMDNPAALMRQVEQATKRAVVRRHLAKTFTVNKGDTVWYGKYKNQRGVVEGFSMGDKGDPLITVEQLPAPSSRNPKKKSPKQMKLFNIRPRKKDEHDETGKKASRLAAKYTARKEAAGASGDCYDSNGRYFMDKALFPGSDKSLRLVHGEVTGQGPLAGVNYGHCWIEDGNTVIDVSNGKTVRMPKAVYYALGGIDNNDNLHKYTAREFRSKVTRHEHWGPWDLRTSTGL
jgi:tRNA nucleotidyltransferase/poly(A) polymerase